MTTYISIDVEADGPIPGQNSMLSLGAAAFDERGNFLESFCRNLAPLPLAVQDPGTMEWWRTQGDAWKSATEGAIDPGLAMGEFDAWMGELPRGHLVAVGYPVTYDFMFVYWYLVKFVGRSRFGFQGLDIKTLAMAKLGCDYRSAVKRNMPKEWFRGCGKHTHRADEDAIEQGRLFCNILHSVAEPLSMESEADAVGGVS